MIYGVLAVGLNTLLLQLTMTHFVEKAKKFRLGTFLVFFVLRYALLGALVYVFLTRQWGSPIGLLAGITVGLLAFMVVRRFV
jgi:hypothetical protein